MDEHKVLAKEALQLLNTADHLAYMTYPMLNDPKLLITISQNLYNALIKAVDSILYYEVMYKRIPNFRNTFEDKMHVFRENCLEKYRLDRNGFWVLKDLKEILDEHNKSAVEFRRRDSFVICSDNYRLKTLNLAKVKDFIHKSKPFIEQTNRIIGKK